MSKLPKIVILLFLCNILRKKWVRKLIFCMQIIMKVCYKLILSFWWVWPSILKVPKIGSLQCLYNISKKKFEMKLIFCRQINIKVSFKLILTLVVKVFYKVILSCCWAWSSIFKALKVASLQYLYNVSKKKLGTEFIKVSTS